MSKARTFRMPDTGQNRVYDHQGRELAHLCPGDELYGQDGSISVHPMSFAKLDARGNQLSSTACWEDGFRLVRDNNTGLVWEVKSPVAGDLNYRADTYTFREASEVYAARLNKSAYGGFTDWRIPNKDELRSILDYGRLNPVVDPLFFPHCMVGLYWCSLVYQMQPCCGWAIFFGYGSATAIGLSSARYVRAVRGGYDPAFGKPDQARFRDNGDGTVTDKVSGLMWQKGENPRMNWFDALKATSEMKLAGYTDWRLPNIKELNTILNLNYTDGWWYYKDFFPAEGLEPPLLHYFSSTVHESYYVWVTNFCYGYDGYYANKKAPLLHRAVRNVEPPEKVSPVFFFPDSGQKKFYDDEGNEIACPKTGEKFAGQDGAVTVNPMRFTKLRENGNELPGEAGWQDGLLMVRDENTGLVWEIKSPLKGEINYLDDRYSLEDAGTVFIRRLNKARYGGFDDWRLPNREELRSIVDYNDITPTVDTRFFPDCQPEFYLSTDLYHGEQALVWGIYFGYGCGICYLKSLPHLVRAVRGGCNRSFGDPARYSFRDNGDGTVTDLNTGLVWKKEESPELNWEEALQYCAKLKLAGHRDWRLPNMKEIATLVDLSLDNPLWYRKEYFPGVKAKPLGFYWSSTTFSSTFAWGVNFQFGYDGYYGGKKQGRYPFRPVRNAGREKVK